MKSLLKQVWTYLLILAVMPLKAENYPYRSDVLWVTVPDHADWLYETGEQAEVEIQFYKYGIPQDEVEVTYELGSDMMPADKSGKVTLKNGRAVIRLGTMKEPGFLDCRLSAKVNETTYKHHIKVGFSPEKLQPYTQQPADFNEFWEKAIEEAGIWQIKYYMYYLEEKGVKNIQAEIDYPLLHQTEQIILEQNDKKILKKVIEEIEELYRNDKIPKKIDSKICKKCAYYDLCYV